MPRYFTLDQAHDVLPGVERLIRQALALKSDYASAETELQQINRNIMMAGGSAVNRDHVMGLKTRKDSSLELLNSTLEEIQHRGCLVKDLDVGLLDFPTLYGDQEVYLCWRLGEDRIEWWHGIEEGFRGRKRIDQDFLAQHRGDLAS